MTNEQQPLYQHPHQQHQGHQQRQPYPQGRPQGHPYPQGQPQGHPYPQGQPQGHPYPQGQYQGPPYPPYQQSEPSTAFTRMMIPIDRSILAVFAGYFGLLSPLLIFAPLAIILGILAIRSINQSQNTPNPKYGQGRAVFGIIMGVISLLAYLFIWFN